MHACMHARTHVNAYLCACMHAHKCDMCLFVCMHAYAYARYIHWFWICTYQPHASYHADTCTCISVVWWNDVSVYCSRPEAKEAYRSFHARGQQSGVGKNINDLPIIRTHCVSDLVFIICWFIEIADLHGIAKGLRTRGIVDALQEKRTRASQCSTSLASGLRTRYGGREDVHQWTSKAATNRAHILSRKYSISHINKEKKLQRIKHAFCQENILFHLCVCVRARPRACVRACEWVSVRVCTRVCMCVCVCHLARSMNTHTHTHM